MSEDATQNVRLDKHDRDIDDHEKRLQRVERTVAVMDSRFDSQDRMLDEIKQGTGQIKQDLVDEMRRQADARAQERKEERQAKSAWWNQVFKLAATVLPILGTLMGGGYYAVSQAQQPDATTQQPEP